jgi:hypothetical protein
VVAYLGELKPSEKSGWAKLGAHLEARIAGNGSRSASAWW